MMLLARSLGEVALTMESKTFLRMTFQSKEKVETYCYCSFYLCNNPVECIDSSKRDSTRMVWTALCLVLFGANVITVLYKCDNKNVLIPPCLMLSGGVGLLPYPLECVKIVTKLLY